MLTEEIHVINRETAFTLSQTAKLLNFDVGRTQLMKMFREWGLLLKTNEPSQSMVSRGYMFYWLKPIERNGKTIKGVPVTLVTIAGLAFLRKYINKKLKKQQDEGAK